MTNYFNNKNANAFGFTVHGNLTTPEGEKVRFKGMSRSVWDGVDFNTFKSVEKISLNKFIDVRSLSGGRWKGFLS